MAILEKIAPSKLNVTWASVAFALSLLLPSTAIIEKYFDIIGVVVYATIASLLLLLFIQNRIYLAQLSLKFTERQVFLMVILTFTTLLMIFALVYPIANSGTYGQGSDGDEALNIATTELLHGRYPYYPRTYLGNLISPLPGELLLASPFVLLGNGAYQNFFWLLIFFFTMKSYLNDSRSALLLLWVIFALSPAVVHGWVIGSDYISNSLYVLLFMMWMVTSTTQQNISILRKLLPAILLGIGLSSRANFVMLLPLLFSLLNQIVGWKLATKYTAVTIIAFMVITLPFYLYDPEGFSPLHTTRKLAQFQTVLPFAGLVIPLANGILALILALLFQDSNLKTLLRNCMIVLAFPVLCGIVLSSIQYGKIDFSFAYFGIFFLFFGVAAFWDSLFENIKLEPIN